MGTSILTHTQTDANGNAIEYVARFRLTTAAGQESGFRKSDGSGVAAICATSSNSSGVISISLENNTNIDPGGSYYIAELLLPSSNGGTQEAAILSASSAATRDIYDSLVSAIPDYVPPTTVPPTILSGNNTFTGTNTFTSDVHFGTVPWADVRTYGAVGNGVTDDTAAFNAAKAALGVKGGIIFCPPGTYMVSTFDLDVAGMQIWGVSPDFCVIRITGSTFGIRLYAADNAIRDVFVQANSTSTASDLIRLEAHTATTIERARLDRVRIYGNAIPGIIGLYLKGVALVAGVYNGTFVNLDVTGCAYGIVSYTVTSGTDTPISNLGNQFNGTHQFISATISGNTTAGILANTALQHTFIGSDIESNGQGVNVAYIQSWCFFGGFGIQGNTTNWSIGTQAVGEILIVGAGATAAGDNSVNDTIGQTAMLLGRAGAQNQAVLPYINFGRPSDTPGGISRLSKMGSASVERKYLYDAIANTSSKTTATGHSFIPPLANIADLASNTYLVVTEISAQEANSGDSGSFVIASSFEVARSGSATVCTKNGSTVNVTPSTVMQSIASTSNMWVPSHVVDGTTTGFLARLVVPSSNTNKLVTSFAETVVVAIGTT